MFKANGKSSNTATLLWLSWIISVFLILISLLDIDKTIWGISIRPVDPSVILFLLAPTGGLYAYRRHEERGEKEEELRK